MSRNLVDVHIGVSGRENSEWFSQCLTSLVQEPVVVHLLDAVPGNIGAMRAEGFSRGTSEWVACVDPDDYITPGAFTRALPHLVAGVSAYYTNHSIIIDEQAKGSWFHTTSPAVGFAQAKDMHHLTIYRRSVIAPVLHLLDGMQTKPYAPLNLQAIMTGDVIGADLIEYHWRNHPGGLHNRAGKTIPRSTQEWMAAAKKNLLGPSLATGFIPAGRWP